MFFLSLSLFFSFLFPMWCFSDCSCLSGDVNNVLKQFDIGGLAWSSKMCYYCMITQGHILIMPYLTCWASGVGKIFPTHHTFLNCPCIVPHNGQTLKTSLRSAFSIWQYHQILGPEVAPRAGCLILPPGISSYAMTGGQQFCCVKGLLSRHNCLLCLSPFQIFHIQAEAVLL